MRTKHCLIVVAEEQLPNFSLEFIKNIFSLFAIEYKIVFIEDENSLDSIDYSELFCVNLLYFIGHSNSNCFGNDHLNFDWLELSYKIKSMDFVCKNATIIFESCSGFSKRMKQSIFENCENIGAIIAYSQDLEYVDGLISTILLLYLGNIKNEDLNTSLLKTSNITESSLSIIDRETYETTF